MKAIAQPTFAEQVNKTIFLQTDALIL